jgi:thiol-disulfide isomerase/thioredoxin
LGFALTLVRDEPSVIALLYLFLYGLGTAIPLLLIGYGGQKAVSSARFLSQYSGRIKQFVGVLLILSAVAFRFDFFLNVQAWFVEHTSYGTIGTDLEERLFGDRITESSTANNQEFDRLPVLGTAPEEFIAAGTWHNSPALELSALKGKVVLIDFWTYSCINCIRTLPYIRGYWNKYRDQPFVLIGVHSPEFIFEKSEKNVADAIKKYELTYPVVQDNDFGIWRSFGNRYWPAKYLIDAEGKVRYTHFGEGAYEETDQAIASLLAEMGVEMNGEAITEEDQPGGRKSLTPETYLGSRSWNSLQNRQGSLTEGSIIYQAPVKTNLHQYVLVGTWKLADEERQILLSESGEIRIRALAGEVNLVLGLEPGMEKAEAVVEVNGVETSRFTIDHHDLYTLFKGEYGEHDIVLRLQGKGVSGYAFTFGG